MELSTAHTDGRSSKLEVLLNGTMPATLMLAQQVLEPLIGFDEWHLFVKETPIFNGYSKATSGPPSTT